MRLNFTGRKKIDKQHAKLAFPDDPVGSKRGWYFDLRLKLDSYKLPAEARVFAEAWRGLVLRRFDLGTVGELTELTAAERRLDAFDPQPDGVKMRVKVVQPDGPEAGKLLAEADGLVPEDGATPLIYIAGKELGETPFEVELVETAEDLPTLWINMKLRPKTLPKRPEAKPLLLTAAVREVFAKLVEAGDHEDNPDHWASLWGRFSTQVLKLEDPSEGEGWDDDHKMAWVEQAVEAFAKHRQLAQKLDEHLKAEDELAELEDAES